MTRIYTIMCVLFVFFTEITVSSTQTLTTGMVMSNMPWQIMTVRARAVHSWSYRICIQKDNSAVPS